MRKILLTVVLACLVCMPVFAQFGMFGRGGDMSAMLLGNPDVQKELKLSDDQKKALTKAADARKEAFDKAREDMDREAMRASGEAYTKALAKVKDGLKPEQKKRLLGIQIQAAEKFNSVAIFKDATVAKALKLTEKQKDIVADYEKDAKELMEDAKGDRQKMGAAFQKIGTMGKDSFTKISKTFSDDQKATWKELKGETFDLKMPKRPGRPGRREKPKDDA